LRRSGRSPAAALRAAALALLLPAAPAAAQGELARSLDAESGIELAVEVQDLDGRVVFSHRGGEPMVLASNTKLLTTAAALDRLGADSRWRTELVADGAALWVRGDGDPSLRATPGEDHAEAFLDAAASALREAGLRAFDELVLDDRAFDRERVHPLWPVDQLSYDYSAPVSALSVGGNVLELRIGRDQRLRLDPQPGDAVRLDRRPRSGQVFSAFWTDDLALRVQGDLARPATGRLALRAPVAFFGAWLRAGLEARGVRVERVRLAEEAEAFPAAEPVLAWDSAWTVGEAVMLANKESDNFVSEVLLRTLGARAEGEGSAAAGARAVAAALADLGVDTSGLNQADGSGYARGGEPPANAAPPRLLCELLRAMAHHPARALYFDSLVVGGEEGRLRSLFDEPPFAPRAVRAKTGWITGSSSLSGYLLGGEDVLVFSIVVNYVKDNTPRTNGKRFRAVQEELLREVLQSWTDS
jgi:D-alanyl-D-alanine carboxypeptidase/D-alanyl-D-alanine-endopeptidase (penicillin-binding protein 4)